MQEGNFPSMRFPYAMVTRDDRLVTRMSRILPFAYPVGVYFDMSIKRGKAVVKQKIIFFCKMPNKIVAPIVYII